MLKVLAWSQSPMTLGLDTLVELILVGGSRTEGEWTARQRTALRIFDEKTGPSRLFVTMDNNDAEGVFK